MHLRVALLQDLALVPSASVPTVPLLEAFSDDRHMRYVGAVIGLTIGYMTKYQLDRRFVFRADPL